MECLDLEDTPSFFVSPALHSTPLNDSELASFGFFVIIVFFSAVERELTLASFSLNFDVGFGRG